MASGIEKREQLGAPANGQPDKGHNRFSRHPIPQLQGPFEESILETIGTQRSDRVTNLDAQTRRRNLLENFEYERLCGRKWRQRANERYHPFWKLIAQMSFGIYLLFRGLAKSDMEVLKILQIHVDEMDGFLGRTSEDFLIIQIDVRTRTQYLKLPLQNLDIFDEMLEERSFRLSMIDYNDKIEHAVERFAAAIRDAIKDIQKGREAISALWVYLRQAAQENGPLPAKMLAVYNAMLANSEGWNVAFSKLHRRGFTLQSTLLQLDLAIMEMQRRVGMASRKSVVSYLQNSKSHPRVRSLRERLVEKGVPVTAAASPNKPLPRAPDIPTTANVPTSRERRRITQKSVPNLRAARTQDEHKIDAKGRGRANSANGPSDGLDSEGIILRLRRLSRPRLKMKGSASDNTDQTATRPSTAPSRTSKARSVSLEQLKPPPKNRKEQPQGAQESFLLSQEECSTTSQTLLRRETMKNQLLQYFKSDRVIDAWECTTQKERENPPSSQPKKDGPWSKFCTDLSCKTDASMKLGTNIIATDSKGNMDWLQEGPELMNTYSLKPKRDVDPRIHIHSVQLDPTQEKHDAEDQGSDDGFGAMMGDAQITALPSIPTSLSSKENAHQNLYRRQFAEPVSIFT
ncbi:hypothetical protein BO71DRAFT_333982 [Aspergillus ellipticus CBS 707.79]|uniref:Uncharacterized protein n=1 Tax=Aspergillus ellipticus CBS 707.79 TaxID=1448320 RepID=A0A319D0B7_9EURO|nr:hypothetical protein BO71DRAFT_333982 [Aspergillus ellipticus CBS 707.79]